MRELRPLPVSQTARHQARPAVSSPGPICQERVESACKAPLIEGLTLPYNQDIPAECMQRPLCPCISLNIATKFVGPVRGARLRRGGSATARMSVPKAAVYENNFAKSGEHQIGASRQIAPVQSKTEAQAMDNSSDCHFRTRVFAPDSTHETRTSRINTLHLRKPASKHLLYRVSHRLINPLYTDENCTNLDLFQLQSH